MCVMGHEPPYPSATFAGPAEILTENIGAPTATIMQRITRAAELPEPRSDEALAGRLRRAGAIVEDVVPNNGASAPHAPPDDVASINADRLVDLP